MLDWIIKNKEWVFSGIGVLGISGVFALIVAWIRFAARTRERRAAANAPKPLPVYNRISKLTAREITDAYFNAPVLYRSDAIKPYIGVVVKWEVRLIHTHGERNGFVTLQLDSIDRGAWDVDCMVRLSDYPELGYATNETPITVTGKIAGAGGVGTINLNEAVLAFPETDTRMEGEAAQAQLEQKIAAARGQLDREFAAALELSDPSERIDRSLAALEKSLDAHILYSTDSLPENFGDAMTEQLFARAPILRDLPRAGKPTLILAVNNPVATELATRILDYLKVNGYALSQDTPALIMTDHGRHIGVTLHERATCLHLIVGLDS